VRRFPDPTVEEAAATLGVPAWQVRLWIERGEVAVRPLGSDRVRRVSLRAVRELAGDAGRDT
jgi:hypothetical protein